MAERYGEVGLSFYGAWIPGMHWDNRWYVSQDL